MFSKCLLGLAWLYIGSANAGLVQWDAFEVGDELAVKDESTGLIWLDLSVTAGQSYYDVGGAYTGWEYANYIDVKALLEGFFPDIVFSGELGEKYFYEQNCANTTTCYSASKEWQDLFGSIAGDPSYQTRSFGLYEDADNILRMGGAYLNGTGSANRYGTDFNIDHHINYAASYLSLEYYSTFLVFTDSVPADDVDTFSVNNPANSYMFILMAAGLLQLRRKLIS